MSTQSPSDITPDFEQRDLLSYALKYVLRNWRVLPLHTINEMGQCSCGHDDCGSKGKHPRIANGVKDATLVQQKVRQWWSETPKANLGVSTGYGLLVIDIDPRHGGSLEVLDDLFPCLPQTATVRTGGGGWHLYYSYDPGITLGNTAGKLADGIDTRADGGYVVAPPSLHASGHSYAWQHYQRLSKAPDDLIQLLLQPKKHIFLVIDNISSEPQLLTPSAITEVKKIAPEGKRNTFLTNCAGKFRNEGYHIEAVRLLLHAANQSCCVPPLPHIEVEQIVGSAATWVQGGQRTMPPSIAIKLDPLLKMNIPEPAWAIPGLLPEGVTILAGKPKMGKSWLALQIGLAVASGNKVLGQLLTRQGEVCYLGLEDSKSRMKTRVEKLLQGQRPPEGFGWYEQWPLLNQGGLTDLEDCLLQNPAVRLVIIDTLARVRTTTNTNSNIYGEDYSFITPLKQLAEQHHIALLLIHHLRKSGASDPIDEISGSSGLTGAADTLMVLQRDHGETLARLSTRGRDTAEQELRIDFDKETAHWSLVQEDEIRTIDGRRLHKDRQEIMSVLEEAEEALSPTEIAQKLGKRSDSVGHTLRKMEKERLVCKQAHGKYVVNDVAESSRQLFNEEIEVM